MLDFLTWSYPFLGISFPIVFGLAAGLMAIAFGVNNETLGAYLVSFIVIMLLVWGIWIGMFHVYPVVY